jgi:hypothetical protein
VACLKVCSSKSEDTLVDEDGKGHLFTLRT